MAAELELTDPESAAVAVSVCAPYAVEVLAPAEAPAYELVAVVTVDHT